ncbi:sensor histidine kinase, partial [Barnesiella intestinihominis]|uniref:sensor histidine kinase n=1 Tax=Barnesiella intestinihominis TaxID=487174 RepID=UPI003AB2682A
IDGIKIYRDGIIATPFAEAEANPDRKRDILGIDKRLWQDIFNRISTREIIGILDITKDGNPKIIDATNRQDFIDNREYRELKEFILEQLRAFEELKIYKRELKRASVSDELKTAKENVDTFAHSVNRVIETNPDLKKDLQPLVEQATKAGTSVKKAIEEQKKAEKEYIRKENMYLSIMSLQEYAIHIAHAVRTSLGKIQRKAEFFDKYYPDPEEEEYFKLYAKEIYQEMLVLNQVIDFMLSYSKSGLNFEDVNLNELVSGLFKSYETSLKAENIRSIVEIPDNLRINTNRQFFMDILQNMISNSVKALKGVPDKTIKCSGYISENDLILSMSDNGIGIPLEKREWVFGVFNTTTAESGGAGIGLYVVKTRVESLKGKVEVVDSEFGKVGTTIKITLPFKK